MMRTVVILNATAGTGWGDDRLQALRDAFARAGIEAQILTARDGDGIRAHAQAAMARSPDVVVAGGGDGTVSAVASLVQGTPTTLGVLPLGTLNHFAKDLGIPLDPDEAVAAIARGRAIEVDLGMVGGRVFINNSSLGIYPDIVRDRARQQRRLGRGKRWALFWATLTALRRSAFLTVRLSVDGEERRVRTPFVFVGNNAYIMEGFDIGRREGVQDGNLSIYFMRRCSRLGLLGLGLRALFGRLRQARDFEAVLAQEVTVDTRKPTVHVAADGEVFRSSAPLEYRIQPRALRVIVP
jgi:diacylglycerol kinase family enzyme